MRGVAKRAVFVIDPDRVVRCAKILDDAGHLPHLDAVREALESLT